MSAEAPGEGDGVGVVNDDVASQAGAAEFVVNFDAEIGRPAIAPVGSVFGELELADDRVIVLRKHPPGTVETEPVDGVSRPVKHHSIGIEFVRFPVPFVTASANAVGEREEQRDAIGAGAMVAGFEVGRGLEDINGLEANHPGFERKAIETKFRGDSSGRTGGLIAQFNRGHGKPFPTDDSDVTH